MNREKLLRQAEAALAVYQSEPDSPQGKVALRTCKRHLSKLGMRLDDLLSKKHRLGLSAASMRWEKALAELVFCSRGMDVSWSDDCLVHATRSQFSLAKSIYFDLREKVLLAAGRFQNQFKMVLDIDSIPGVIDAFHCYMVVGLAQSCPELPECEMPYLDGVLESPGPAVVEHDSRAPSGHRGHRGAHSKRSVQISPGRAGLEAADAVALAVWG